jgi:hypothetical protein
MKTMANLAMLIGIVLALSALIEAWAGGIGNHDGLSLTAGTLGLIAGGLLFAAGIEMLRNSRRAAARAQGAAVTCLAVFALVAVAAPRMSLLTNILGIGFPIVLLFFLRWTRGQSSSAPTIAALVFAVAIGLPVRSYAQAPARDTTILSVKGRDLPLTAFQRQSYIGRYEAELPDSKWRENRPASLRRERCAQTLGFQSGRVASADLSGRQCLSAGEHAGVRAQVCPCARACDEIYGAQARGRSTGGANRLNILNR